MTLSSPAPYSIGMNAPKLGPAFFEAADPDGFKILLTKRVWFGHVLGSDERVFRTGRFTRDHVKGTIEKPVEVRQNEKVQRLNRVYCREWKGVDKLNPYLRISAWVHEPDSKRGFVTSVVPVAFIAPVDKVSEEKKVWPK